MVIVKYNKIPNGLDDIAIYLGLEPQKTIFLHSTSFDKNTVEGKKRASINKGRMIYSEIITYSSNKENGAKTAVSYIDPNLLEYYNNEKIININNILQVGEDKKIEYPYNSVSYMLNKKVKENEEFRKKIEGFTIVSSYLSAEDVETANIIHGKTIMNIDEQLKFNSKYFFREISNKYNFSIPSGVLFKGINNTEKALNELKNKLQNINGESKFWVKLESQISGTGNIKFSINQDVSTINNEIKKIAGKIYDEEYINSKIPLIMEIDVNSINNEIQVDNIGVEAVIKENEVTILGGVSQETQNGKYIGSSMSEKTEKYLTVAQNVAREAFIAYCKEGYRGFITIDVLVTENKENGLIKGYNIDPNARFSAGTMLLKNIHMAEKKTKRKIFGLSFSNEIKLENNPMNSIVKYAKDNLYKYEKSEYIGIIPVVLNNVIPLTGDRYYIKTVVLDYSYEKALKKYTDFKNQIRSYNNERI